MNEIASIGNALYGGKTWTSYREPADRSLFVGVVPGNQKTKTLQSRLVPSCVRLRGEATLAAHTPLSLQRRW